MPLQKVSIEEILWSSVKVFRRQGYYRTSMMDLAEAVGLTKGAFYHHFPSKEEVMRQSLQVTRQWFEDRVFSIAYQDQLTDKERLWRMAEKTYKAFTDNPGGCFFANTILETVHVEDTFIIEIKHFFTLWENALAHILKDRYEADVLGDMVQQKIAEVEGAIVLMQLHQNTDYLKKALERGMKDL